MTENIEEIKLMVIAYAPKVAGAILTLIIGFWLSGFVAKKVRKIMEKKDVDVSLAPFLTSIVGIGIKILVVLSAASMFGIEVTSFVAIFGALAFAIGLALQGNLSHMAAGVVILLFKYYKVGDYIETQGYAGTVKEIQIFNTLLTTVDNKLIIVPNGGILSEPIENYTAHEDRKIPMTFGIGYDDDIDHAKEVIMRVLKTHDKVDFSKDVDLYVSELADSSVNITVRPWAKTGDFWPIYRYMQEYVKKEFDKEGIGIPFPQMDVHLHKTGNDDNEEKKDNGNIA